MAMLDITKNGRIRISFILTQSEAAALFKALESAGIKGPKVQLPPIDPGANPKGDPSDNGPADPNG